MPPTLAIDVALLPPDEVMKICKQINAELWVQTKAGFPFDETHLSHITLVQQYVPAQQFQSASAQIEKIASTTAPQDFRVTKINEETFEGLNIVSLDLSNSPQTQKLQQDIMGALEPFVASGNEDSWYKNPDEYIKAGSLRWLENFRKKHVDSGNYHPHITLGVGPSPTFSEPLQFTASRLAICHLGNFNTCRKILHQRKLR